MRSSWRNVLVSLGHSVASIVRRRYYLHGKVGPGRVTSSRGHPTDGADGSTYGPTDVWTDERTSKRTDGWTGELTRRTDGGAYGLTDARTDGRTHGLTDGRTTAIRTD